MAFFEWKGEYETGIEKIDEQHKVIVKLMNELFDAIRTGKDNQIMKDVYIELLKYANYHFGLEAKLFKQYKYENEKRHIEEHKHFIRKIETVMINDYLTQSPKALDILHYLRKWFQDHMLKIDMEYCRFFNYKEIMKEIEKFLNEKENQIPS